MSNILVKIKRINNIVKHLTLLLKSFKRLLEIVFYIFLMIYIGFDKIKTFNVIKVKNEIEVDYADASSNVIELSKETDVDYVAIGVVVILLSIVIYKIIGLFNKK